MPVTDLDEWLQPGAVHDEIVLHADDVPAGIVLDLRMVVTPTGRSVALDVRVDGARARHDAEAAGPPTANWDRMAVGGVEWRMVEPLHCWDLSVQDAEAGLRAYLTFTGTGPPTTVPGGYEQLGTLSGQLQLADSRTTLTNTPARRSHIWR